MGRLAASSQHIRVRFAAACGRGRAEDRFSRYVGQPDHVGVELVVGHEAERWPGACEVGRAVTEYDRMQVDPILIDQAELGEAPGQAGAGNLHLPVALGCQSADRSLEIVIVDERGVGTD
jgi:hypothetical protein